MEWMSAGLAEIESQRQRLDQYNLFPVPDGDTGRNMTGTVAAAVDAMRTGVDESLGSVLERIADGALMGARGNSGVILSQIFAGFAEVGRGKVYFEVAQLKEALARAAERARQQVANPVEGTILTVADAIAAGALDDGDLTSSLEAAVKAGEDALAKTADQLPQLVGSGLVDAGALGYVSVLRGWLRAARGEYSPQALLDQRPSVSQGVGENMFSAAAVTYYYDVEALLYRFKVDDPETMLASRLSAVGDSIVIAPGLHAVKVHVHTDKPVALLEILTDVGDIRQMEWLDMRAQVEAQHGERRLVVVADRTLHPLFDGMCAVLDPDQADDTPDTLWVQPVLDLEQGLAVPTVGLAGQAALEYVPGDPWEVNKERMQAQLAAMRHWIVLRQQDGYCVNGQTYTEAEALRDAVVQDLDDIGVLTIYLSQHARREEAAYWQDALGAELVQVPLGVPWMEIVWQP